MLKKMLARFEIHFPLALPTIMMDQVLGSTCVTITGTGAGHSESVRRRDCHSDNLL